MDGFYLKRTRDSIGFASIVLGSPVPIVSDVAAVEEAVVIAPALGEGSVPRSHVGAAVIIFLVDALIPGHRDHCLGRAVRVGVVHGRHEFLLGRRWSGRRVHRQLRRREGDRSWLVGEEKNTSKTNGCV